jgi:hypothetical protein
MMKIEVMNTYFLKAFLRLKRVDAIRKFMRQAVIHSTVPVKKLRAVKRT